jgi:hypothetical protein
MASASAALQRSSSEQETPDGQSHVVIPPVIDDCDVVPSPSQHRLSFASQHRQASLDSIGDDKDQDDDTHSEEEEGDAERSIPSEGEEEEGDCKNSEEEEQHEDEAMISVMSLMPRIHVLRRNSSQVRTNLSC